MDETAQPGVHRVLMTGDTVGGVWTFTLHLAGALGRSGVEVVLASLGGSPSPAQLDEAARIPNLRVLHSGFKLEWMPDPWRDVEASGRWLLQLEREYSPDVVHLNSFGHGGLSWRTPTLLTAHSCVLSWWLAVRGESAPAEWLQYRTRVARSLRSVDIVIAPSRAIAASLQCLYDMDAGCTVIPNGLPPDRFRTVPKEPFIFTAGRLWDEGKNVAAVASIARDIPWPVYVAGDPGGLELPNCRKLGRLSAAEIAGWYARASIYALPARYEPFGLSVLEAALSGCALVLGDIPSLREIWGDAALFVPPEDHAALRVTLEGLIRNAHLRRELSGLARARALVFDIAQTAELYLDAYRQAAVARRRLCVS